MRSSTNTDTRSSHISMTLPGPKAQALLARDRPVTTPSYPRDNAFYLAWDEIARDRGAFTAWMERHVLEVPDHAALLRALGVAA